MPVLQCISLFWQGVKFGQVDAKIVLLAVLTNSTSNSLYVVCLQCSNLNLVIGDGAAACNIKIQNRFSVL